VFRPSLTATLPQRALRRNLGLDLFAAIGVGTTVALVSALLPTIGRRGGLEPIGLAALAAAPFVANLLSAFAGRVGPRSPGQLAAIRGGGAASLLVLAVVTTAPLLILVSLVYWLSLSMSGPFQLRLWGAMYPPRLRGRIVGMIGSGKAAAAAVAALIGGLAADHFGGPTAMLVAGAVGAVCALGYAGLQAPTAERPAGFSARDSIRALRERTVLSKLALAQGFYGGGLIAAAPLYAIVNVDRLDLSMADVGILAILSAVSNTLAFLVWGVVADRRGPILAMRIGALLGLGSLLAYAVAPEVRVLYVASIAAGIAGASIDVGIAAVISDQTTLASRSAAMAGWNALTGARGIVAAFAMSILLQVGIVDVTTGLLLCAAVSGVGVALFWRTEVDDRAEGRARDRVGSRILAPMVPARFGRAVSELRSAVAR
jgi:MFS transporter, DHA1 family, staphyloferrin B biosynthesis exporter